MKLPVPDLSEAAFVRAVAGVRPCREGGLRLEAEKLRGRRVVHNYGHGGCGVTLAPGCAAEVVRLLPGATSVAVLGAGVAGLASARALLLAGRSVTVYAERSCGETTSALAGALWLPTGVEFPPPGAARDRFNRILREGYEIYLGLMSSARYAGLIERVPVYEPAGSPDEDHLFESGVVERVPAAGAMPGGMTSGRMYETLFIHNPEFLTALRDEVLALGGEIRSATLRSLEDVFALDEASVVTCLGLGAGSIFGDRGVFPARGVLVQMKPQRIGYSVHDGYKYLFPRRSALILGGTYEPGESSTEPPERTVREILEHHRAFFAAHAPA